MATDSGTKRRREGDGLTPLDGRTSAELVSQHYSSRKGQDWADRKRSDVISLREYNNWVKSVLLRRFAHKGDAVLDLACGKGGDLPKWREAGISAYVGVDIATESVRKDARERYNKAGFVFPAALFVADAFEAPLGGALAEHVPFDLVSCQFALHYAFSSEQRARRALQNVADVLRPGGYFIGTTADADVLVRKLRAVDGLCVSNSVFSCVFDARFAGKTFDVAQPFGLTYKFTLADAVEELPEYLVHRPTLERLAAEVGLHLTMWQNFDQFVVSALDRTQAETESDRRMWVQRGLGGVVDDATGACEPAACVLSPDEWEVAHLYAAFAFRKEGDAQQPAARLHRRAGIIDRGDVKRINADGRLEDLR